MQRGVNEITIYVVGTMGAGRKTLINAMIGKKLIPFHTTDWCGFYIENSERIDFQGIAFDANRREIIRDDFVTRKIIQEWFEDEKIVSVKVSGRIPFVDSSSEITVRIVEVPLLNKPKAYDFLQNIDNDLSFVIFLSRCDYSFLSHYDNEFLEIVYRLKKDDVKFYERFIFAVNKMDVLNPEEGEYADLILQYHKESLEKIGFQEAHIFPVSAQAALEARTRPTIEQVLPVYRQYIKYFPSTHFDSYYQFSHLPNHARIETRKILTEAFNNPDKTEVEYASIEIHSGIVSIEMAIMLYINKYINKSIL